MLELAGRLRDIESDTAPAGLHERTFNPDAIADTFDLAEALLKPDSIAAALRVRSRAELTLLRAVSTEAEPVSTVLDRTGLNRHDAELALDRCESLFFVSVADGMVHGYPEVIAELDASEVLPLDALRQNVAPVAVAAHSIDTTLLDRRAAETAARISQAVAEVIVTLELEPARELAKGGLALPDLKRLAAATHLELEQTTQIHRLAATSCLVVQQNGIWLAAVEAERWLASDTAARWAALATAVWNDQPAELRSAARELVTEAPREVSGLSRLTELIEWQFPSFDDADAAVARFARVAELVGILAGTEFSATGRLLASGATEDLAQRLAPLLPASVSQVYVQPDLSIVVPGPAAPQLDRALRRFADVEQADLASTFRLSAASVNRALASGMTVEQIRQTLTEASISELPQPVSYLLDDAAARFGAVRVRSCDEPPVATAVRALDPAMLDLLEVDQSLSNLAFHRDGDRLLSRVSPAHTLLVLDAAKVPAALEDEHGHIIPLRASIARAHSAASATDPVGAMWLRVRAASHEPADGTAWLARQISAAVKNHTRLIVEVRLPDGGSMEYLLEPTGLAGNRMRARDRRAEIERTLPLASIVSVRAAEPRIH